MTVRKLMRDRGRAHDPRTIQRIEIGFGLPPGSLLPLCNESRAGRAARSRLAHDPESYSRFSASGVAARGAETISKILAHPNYLATRRSSAVAAGNANVAAHTPTDWQPGQKRTYFVKQGDHSWATHSKRLGRSEAVRRFLSRRRPGPRGIKPGPVLRAERAARMTSEPVQILKLLGKLWKQVAPKAAGSLRSVLHGKEKSRRQGGVRSRAGGAPRKNSLPNDPYVLLRLLATVVYAVDEERETFAGVALKIGADYGWRRYKDTKGNRFSPFASDVYDLGKAVDGLPSNAYLSKIWLIQKELVSLPKKPS
jgi:hypothetical protein